MDYPICAETSDPLACFVRNLLEDLHVADEGFPGRDNLEFRDSLAQLLQLFSLVSLKSWYFSRISHSEAAEPEIVKVDILTFDMSG